MLQPFIDHCLKLEITQIQVVQDVFQPTEPVLEQISYFTNPRILHLYFLPLFLAFSVKSYVQVLIAATSSHIFSLILKWILAEDRPYWWVSETPSYTAFTRPSIRQTYLTCETSAGNPSSHVMVLAAVLYAAQHEILQNFQWYRNAGNILRCFIWNIFILILAIVTMSRIYFASHFLHQCVLGAALGVSLSKLLRRPSLNLRLTAANLKKSITFGILVTTSILSLYFGQLLLQRDPLWTIRKAFNWCKDPYFIKPESTPVYSLVREMGLLFGLILCQPNVKRFGVKLDLRRSLPAVLGVIVVNSIIYDNIPRWNGAVQFYLCSFLLNVAFVVTLLVGVPKVAQKTLEVPELVATPAAAELLLAEPQRAEIVVQKVEIKFQKTE